MQISFLFHCIIIIIIFFFGSSSSSFSPPFFPPPPHFHLSLFFFCMFTSIMAHDIQFMCLYVQGAKTGGITSGYPIRAQPVPAPPHAPSHVTTGSYQPNVSTPHVSTLYC